jgi:transcriptional regulator with XRE-family HTH domain
VTDAPNKIRELRMEKKLSQQAVADRIGVSKVTISDLERGEMQLTVEYMRRIAKALGVEAADLLSRNDNPTGLSAAERELIERLRAADPDQRDQLRKVAEVMLPWKGSDRDAA